MRCSVTSSTSITTGPGPARSANGAAVSRSTRPVPLQPRRRRGAVRSPRWAASISPRHRLRASRQRLGRSSARPAPAPAVSASAASARLARSTAPAGPDHGDPFGQGVERRLPLLLAPADDLVQPAVGQHHRGVGGHGREQPEILGGERPALAVGHRERAHGDALRAERGHGRRADGQPADQVHRRLRRALRHLDPLALDGEAHERACRDPR